MNIFGFVDELFDCKKKKYYYQFFFLLKFVYSKCMREKFSH